MASFLSSVPELMDAGLRGSQPPRGRALTLRLAAIGVSRILGNLRTLWRGGPPPAGVLDFHCEKVLIRFDRDMPLQVGGDAEGYRRETVLEMAERPLELLDFRTAGRV